MIRHWTVMFGMALGLAVPLTFSDTAMAGDKVTLEEVPAPVRETITRETQGGEIREIERETKDGQTVYEVEFKPKEGAQKVELKIGQDGKILKRETKY